MNDINKFQEGMIVYHKATGLRCVVIQINDDKKTVKVRTKEDLERNYYPQELKTAEEEKAEIKGVPPEDMMTADYRIAIFSEFLSIKFNFNFF